MKEITAKVVETAVNEYECLVYSRNKWRVFGTPFSVKNKNVTSYRTKYKAIAGAKKIADAFGINLRWV